MLHFGNPWFGLLLLPMAMGSWLAIRQQRPALVLADAGGVPENTAAGRLSRYTPLALYAAGLTVLVGTLMRPRSAPDASWDRVQGIDIMLVLDVSGSMMAYDTPPGRPLDSHLVADLEAGRIDSRITVARRELLRFTDSRPCDRVGLLAFARVPYLLCPPTLDRALLRTQLATLQAGRLPDGSGLAAALSAAVNRLHKTPSPRRVAVLFTDGEDNVTDRVTPMEAACIARAQGVTVHSVGVGSPRAVMRVPGLVATNLRQVPSGLNETLLRAMATETSGIYRAASDAAAFATAVTEIDTFERSEFRAARFAVAHDVFMAWLLTGMSLICLAVLLESTVLLGLP